MPLHHHLHRLLTRWVANRRPPDFVIRGEAGNADDYLRRWWVIPRNPLFNLYLHQVLRSDDDRALHCHPWASISIILAGSYTERVPARQSQDPAMDYQPGCTRDHIRLAGNVIRRSGKARHRLIVDQHSDGAWTLFITGPVYRRWGFWCAKGWRYWKDYISDTDRGVTGRGCA